MKSEMVVEEDIWISRRHWMLRDTVEIWMMENGRKINFRVDKDRLFVLGMKTYPEIIDLTEISEASSKILQNLLIGNRRYSACVPLNEAAEILHVAHELEFVNLMKIMEKDLIGQTSKSMKQAVDSLNISMEFDLKEAVEKLVDEIVFSFLDEQLLIYCKNPKALEMIMNRKSELMAQETPIQAEYPAPRAESTVGLEPLAPRQDQRIALPQLGFRQNNIVPKVIFTAAKEKFRIIMNRPINSVKNGIAWVSAQTRRQRPRNDGFEEFLDFDHF